MHVLGGLAPGWRAKALNYEYDPGTNAWKKKKNMALASHHVALAELNGKIYVFGGFVSPTEGQPSWVPIDNAWEYTPETDTWKALAPMPSKRGSVNAVVVNGKIHVIGGAGVHPGSKETASHPARPHRAVGTHDVYDPATDKWEPRSPMPTARNHAAAGVVNGKIYVIAGRIGSAFISTATNIDIVEEYDPAIDQWGRLLAPMPGDGRSASGWGVYNNRIYVVGGETRSNGLHGTFKKLQAYDPATNSWAELPPMAFHRHGLAADILNGRLHAVSGNMQSGGGPGAHVETDVHEVIDLSKLK
jgi:N-acetylneuraminic acid mutarotase